MYLSHSSCTSLAVSSASYSVSCTLLSKSAHVCMYVCKPVWKKAMGNGFPVHRDPLGWSLVRIASQASNLLPRHVSAHCTLSYPFLPYPDLPFPAVLLCLCVCISLLCVSDLAYLSPFVSLSLCYCRGEPRPSMLQPVMAGLRPVRSFCSRERTSPLRTM